MFYPFLSVNVLSSKGLKKVLESPARIFHSPTMKDRSTAWPCHFLPLLWVWSHDFLWPIEPKNRSEHHARRGWCSQRHLHLQASPGTAVVGRGQHLPAVRRNTDETHPKQTTVLTPGNGWGSLIQTSPCGPSFSEFRNEVTLENYHSTGAK